MFAWRALSPDRAGPGPGMEPGAYLTVPALAEVGVRVAFTTRLGGGSGAPYASLNLSFVSGDDPEVVRANRAHALGSIGAAPQDWTSGRQVHGARVERVTAGRRGAGAAGPGTTLPDTDAMWTDEAGAALAVLTADCLPILLADPSGPRIAAVHAGWRGLVAGVVEEAAGAMGASSATVACIGPAIGPCCYEVGADVAVRARDALGSSVVRGGEGARLTLDLWRGAAIALRRAGVRNVRLAALCTRCESHRFYSHRAGHAGRQALLARIEPQGVRMRGGARAGGGDGD